MKILVTGAAGFVGSNICKRLHELGNTVVAVDNLSFGYRENLQLLENTSVFKESVFSYFVEDDFINYGNSDTFDLVIHCATANIIYAMQNRDKTIKTNLVDTMNFFNKVNCPIIYLSTASVYGNASIIPTPETATLNPTEIYSQTKLMIEEYLEMSGKNYTILRLSNVYGPNQWPGHPYSGVISKILWALREGLHPPVFGDGNQTMDFTYVEDVVDAVCSVVELGPLNTEINISSGVETSINQILNMLTGNSNKAMMHPRPIDSITRRCLNRSKAYKLLKWEPRHSLKEGLAKTINWINGIRQIKLDGKTN